MGREEAAWERIRMAVQSLPFKVPLHCRSDSATTTPTTTATHIYAFSLNGFFGKEAHPSAFPPFLKDIFLWKWTPPAYPENTYTSFTRTPLKFGFILSVL